MNGSTCSRCGQSFADAEVLRLWDGRDYCRPCVDAACPALWDFARGRDRLEDAIGFDRTAGLWTWGFTALIFVGGVALTAAGIGAAGDRGAALLFLAAALPIAAIAMLGALPLVFKAKSTLPTVRVRDGIVEVLRPIRHGGRIPETSFPLSSARWHVGKLREDAYCRGKGGTIVADRPAVILRAPRKWSAVVPPSETTACGSTPEMFRVWRGFLKLSGVPEGR